MSDRCPRVHCGGVLVRGVDGERCLNCGRSPDTHPMSLAEHDAETVVTFVTECCIIGPGEIVTSREMYRAFAQWCRDRGAWPAARHTVGIQLRALGYTKGRVGSGTAVWKGLGLP